MKFKISIPADANKLIHTLQNNGYSAYIVGGCVRDSILGRTPHDYDICTSATPSEMLEIFKDKKIIETGLQHGTVTVVVNTKEELNKLKDYNYIGWTPWFWKKMNGKINYLFGISNEGYLKWTEERNPYHRISKYQGIRWSDLSKLFR